VGGRGDGVWGSKGGERDKGKERGLQVARLLFLFMGASPQTPELAALEEEDGLHGSGPRRASGASLATHSVSFSL
jgi:hypothetical protein